MEQEKNIAILEILKDWLKDDAKQLDIKETNGTPVLSALLPVLEDGRGLVLVEIFLSSYSEIADLACIVSTMTPPGPSPGLPALRESLNGWNLNTIAGAYGIYDATGALYHRHVTAVPAVQETRQVAHTVMHGLALSLDEMGRRIVEAVNLTVEDDEETQ